MTLSDKTVEEYLRATFECVRLFNDEPGADEFEVAGYPTTLVLAADGSELQRLQGFYEPAAFLAELKQRPASVLPAAQ